MHRLLSDRARGWRRALCGIVLGLLAWSAHGVPAKAPQDLRIDGEVLPGRSIDLLEQALSRVKFNTDPQQLRRGLVENRLLTENIARMEERNLVDTLTGLGNPRYLRQKLADSLRQVETRGGALCYLLVGMPEAPVLRQRHGEAFHRELLLGVARRLQQLVRPLDVLVRLDEQHFALITLVEDLHECSSSSFKRLHDGLNLKAFKTSEGFISLKAGIAMLGLDSGALPLGIDELLQRTEALLPDAYASGRIATCRLPALR